MIYSRGGSATEQNLEINYIYGLKGVRMGIVYKGGQVIYQRPETDNMIFDVATTSTDDLNWAYFQYAQWYMREFGVASDCYVQLTSGSKKYSLMKSVNSLTALPEKSAGVYAVPTSYGIDEGTQFDAKIVLPSYHLSMMASAQQATQPDRVYSFPFLPGTLSLAGDPINVISTPSNKTLYSTTKAANGWEGNATRASAGIKDTGFKVTGKAFSTQLAPDWTMWTFLMNYTIPAVNKTIKVTAKLA